MANERNKMVIEIHEGYRPRGQRGYQPQTNQPLDPSKLTPPTGGSAVQPPTLPAVQPGNSDGTSAQSQSSNSSTD